MSEVIKEIMNTIPIPQELSERSLQGIKQAETSSLNKPHKLKLINLSILLAATILLTIGYSFDWLNVRDRSDISNEVVVPAIMLPNQSETEQAAMPFLIVYKGRIYSYTWSTNDSNQINGFLGEQIGTAVPTLDEWSEQEEYAVEFASSFSEEKAIYTMKGYDESFRLIAYDENSPTETILLEHLNDLTFHTGEDFFQQLKLEGNISHARVQTWDDYFNERNQFKEVDDLALLNEFVVELNNTRPHEYPREYDERIDTERVDSKMLFLNLSDGISVQLRLYENNYIMYPGLQALFEMEESHFKKVWEAID